MVYPIQMNEKVLEIEVIKSVRKDILQILINNKLNYGEARAILQDIDSYLEEKAFF